MTSETFGNRATNIVVALATAMFLFACNKSVESPVVHVGGNTMGTTWVATLTPPDGSTMTEQDWLGTIQESLDQIDRVMSTYQADSDLNRFTAAESGVAVQLSPHTQKVLIAAREVHRLSAGAFDPTVGALLQLWGFGAQRSDAVQSHATDSPDPSVIEELRLNMGLSKVQSLDGDASIFAEQPSALFLDFSAIAKGYGADWVAENLHTMGVQHFLVEVGGELVASGERPGGGPWRLAIESPLPDQPEITALLTLTDGALATSGNYRKFRELAGGTIISHTIDPRSGQPVKSPPASVSVLAPSCMLADAWATALSVLGPAGLQLIEDQPDLEARMVITSLGDRPQQVITTAGWPPAPSSDLPNQ